MRFGLINGRRFLYMGDFMLTFAGFHDTIRARIKEPRTLGADEG